MSKKIERKSTGSSLRLTTSSQVEDREEGETDRKSE
jgi:hypothetical protein